MYYILHIQDNTTNLNGAGDILKMDLVHATRFLSKLNVEKTAVATHFQEHEFSRMPFA